MRAMKLARKGFASVALLTVIAAAFPVTATVNLTPQFVEQYRFRATISATMAVDASHNTPNSLANDGDIHIAGRSPEIGLRIVAEPMNSYEEWRAVELAKSLKATGGTLSLTGVHRIWPEHAGANDFFQGAALDPIPGDTNPPHIFEVHPITKFGRYDLLHTLRMIPGDLTGTLGFRYKQAAAALNAYATRDCTIEFTPGDPFYRITMDVVGFNYVAIAIKPDLDSAIEVEDGTFVDAKVYKWDGTVVSESVRLVFVRGSEAERALQNAVRVERFSSRSVRTMRVLAMPRLSLQQVWSRANASPGTTTGPIPYEMVVVGYAGVTKTIFP